MKTDTTVVMVGDLSNLLPKDWELDRDIMVINCDLDAAEILNIIDSLDGYYYVLLMPATDTGIRLCSLVRRRRCEVPVVLVGESRDRELLLYSAQLGCMDFLSYEDDMETVKKRLGVYVRLYAMSQKIKQAERRR